METFGQYLKRERTLRQINLKEISAATKINFHILKKLEADDFENLPSPTFVKGFIKAYASHLGLRGKDVIVRYEAYLAQKFKELPQPTLQKPPTKKIKPFWQKFLLPIGVAILVLAGFFFYSGKKPHIEQKPEIQEALMMNVDTNQTWYPLEGKKYYLRTYLDTWIKIQVDNFNTTSFPMAKDTFKTFYAKNKIIIFTSDPTFVSLSEEKEVFNPLSHEKKPQRFIMTVQ
ncbi:MAG: helix-turn-helix domain-containing protein [Deltaproteobacteria bacterium]|nr:helix-turn-helix domain-containing protein [Deltaproteobacteria bacterium]